MKGKSKSKLVQSNAYQKGSKHENKCSTKESYPSTKSRKSFVMEVAERNELDSKLNGGDNNGPPEIISTIKSYFKDHR
jgi:hypothetical protein